MRPFGLAILTLILGASVAIAAPTVVRPGFNIFTVAQDAQIGQQSALEVGKQLPTLNDAAAQRYISALGARLAAQAPGPKFTYQFKVLNLSDVNAFALPGGYVYIHRGLIDQVRTEGELAGVVAHEIAHVALRHPTNQASKAYLAQAGLGVLGGLIGGKSSSSSTGQIVNAIGGFGMNSLFLKFSRSIESQADVVGSQIMARAGYDPLEMAHFFAYLGQKAGGDPGAVARFLSDHPAPADRGARVQQEANLLGAIRRTMPIGSLVAVQAELRRLPAAPTTAQLAAGVTPSNNGTTDPSAGTASAIEQPSARYRIFQQRDGGFQIEQPDNWSATGRSAGFGVTFAPRGGFVTGPSGQANVAYGVIVNHYVPFDGTVGTSFVDPQGTQFGTTSLEQATSDLTRQIQQANPHLNRVYGTERRSNVSGQPSFSVRLAGQSPETGRSERVTVVTRQLSDGHIIYMLMISPGDDYTVLQPAFDHMVRTLRVNSNVAHD